MKYSLIIPVYNVQDYIEQCILSVINQTISKDKYEVIIVNDGTRDNSMEIVKNVDWKGTNYRIINQDNQGLSVARNTGLSVASGEYIWFIDSDDWIESNSIQRIDSILKDSDVLALRSYYKGPVNNQKIIKYDNEVTNGRQLVTHSYPVGAPFYIYNRRFLISNNFKFKEGLFHEDTLFNPVVLYCADTVSSCFVPLYHNRKRSGSITTSFNPKKIKDLEFIFSELVEFQARVVLPDMRKQWGRVLSGILLELLYLSKKTQDEAILNDVREFINNRESKFALKNSLNINSRFLYYMSFLCGGDIYSAYSKLYKVRYK